MYFTCAVNKRFFIMEMKVTGCLLYKYVLSFVKGNVMDCVTCTRRDNVQYYTLHSIKYTVRFTTASDNAKPNSIQIIRMIY